MPATSGQQCNSERGGTKLGSRHREQQFDIGQV